MVRSSYLPCGAEGEPYTWPSLPCVFPEEEDWVVIKLDLGDLGPQPILAFLQHLELDRHNSVATRNVRLAAIGCGRRTT